MAKIVVIDDEESVRHVLSRILQAQGYEVLAFEDARPALDEVDFEMVDLIVTDLQMPTPGEQAIRELRDQGVGVPIVVLSGYLDREKVDELKSLDVQKIVSKPFNLFDLMETVKGLLRQPGD